MKKKSTTRPINIEIIPIDRMQAINNLSAAILETARALNVPSVVIRNIGGKLALNISRKEEK